MTFAKMIAGDRAITQMRAELKRAMEILDGMYRNPKEPIVGIALGRRFEYRARNGQQAVWSLGMPTATTMGFQAWCHVDNDYGFGFDNGRLAIEAPLQYVRAVHESFGSLLEELLTWSPQLAEKLQPLFDAADTEPANDP